MGHLCRINNTYDAIKQEYASRLSFYEKHNKLKSLYLRDNVCYINTTDKYGFNSDMLKVEFK